MKQEVKKEDLLRSIGGLMASKENIKRQGEVISIIAKSPLFYTKEEMDELSNRLTMQYNMLLRSLLVVSGERLKGSETAKRFLLQFAHSAGIKIEIKE